MNVQNLIFLILFIQIFSFLLIFFSFLYKENSYLNKFISKVNVLSDFLIATGIILTYLLFRNTYNKTINDTTLSMNSTFIKIHKELSDNFDKCPNFTYSLRFKFQDGYNANNYNHKDENKITINYISNLIFCSIEDYITTASMNKSSDSAYMASFLSFFNSKELRRKWSILKYNYQTQTKMLINLLIKIINENEFNNSNDVNNYCDNFVKTSYFKEIFEFKDPTIITFQ